MHGRFPVVAGGRRNVAVSTKWARQLISPSRFHCFIQPRRTRYHQWAGIDHCSRNSTNSLSLNFTQLWLQKVLYFATAINAVSTGQAQIQASVIPPIQSSSMWPICIGFSSNGYLGHGTAIVCASVSSCWVVCWGCLGSLQIYKPPTAVHSTAHQLCNTFSTQYFRSPS